MENEIWKDIPGYEGSYQVSNFGNVKSLERVMQCGRGYGKRPERLLKTSFTRTERRGYRIVGLCKNGKSITYLVHRLVALCFIGPCPPGMNVDHIDENILNNQASNLRYLPIGENTARSVKGVCRNPSKNRMEGNPRTKAVIGYSDSGQIIDTLPCAKYLTKKFNINYSTLRRKLQCGGIRIGEIHYQYAVDG